MTRSNRIGATVVAIALLGAWNAEARQGPVLSEVLRGAYLTDTPFAPGGI